MFKRRDWLHIKGADGGGGGSDSDTDDDRSDEELRHDGERVKKKLDPMTHVAVV